MFAKSQPKSIAYGCSLPVDTFYYSQINTYSTAHGMNFLSISRIISYK